MKQFSLFSWFGYPIPMEERFKLMKAAGFRGVLLWWSDEFLEADGDRRRHPELARKQGLFIENIHTPIIRNNGLWEDCLDGEFYERTMLACLEDCKTFEIPTAVVHITYGPNPPPYNQTGLDRIKRLVEKAEQCQVNLAIENLRHIDYLEFVFGSIESGRLGFCYDSGHENCYTKGADLLTQFGSKLMAMHLHDNDGSGDQHWLPGEGAIQWAMLKEKLIATGYQGPIAFEVMDKLRVNPTVETPELFLQKLYRTAQALFG